MDSVLVVTVATEFNKSFRFLYPKIFNSLTYKNKLAAFIDEQDYLQLRDLPTGEQRAAAGRDIGIALAIKKNVDWILFLDLDIEPDVDIIEKMLAVKHPIVGSLNAFKHDSWRIMGHNYKNRKTLVKQWLKRSDVDKNQYVHCVSDKILLVARGIYNKVDYSDYKGPNFLPNYYMTSGEYYQNRLFEKMKILPKVCSNAFSWHYNEDGTALKLFGKTKIWKT